MCLDGGMLLFVTKLVTAVNGNAYMHCLWHSCCSGGELFPIIAVLSQGVCAHVGGGWCAGFCFCRSLNQTPFAPVWALLCHPGVAPTLEARSDKPWTDRYLSDTDPFVLSALLLQGKCATNTFNSGVYLCSTIKWAVPSFMFSEQWMYLL